MIDENQITDRLKEIKNVYGGQIIAFLNKIERNDAEIQKRIDKIDILLESLAEMPRELTSTKGTVEDCTKELTRIYTDLAKNYGSFFFELNSKLNENNDLYLKTKKEITKGIEDVQNFCQKIVDSQAKELEKSLEDLNERLTLEADGIVARVNNFDKQFLSMVNVTKQLDSRIDKCFFKLESLQKKLESIDCALEGYVNAMLKNANKNTKFYLYFAILYSIFFIFLVAMSLYVIF